MKYFLLLCLICSAVLAVNSQEIVHEAKVHVSEDSILYWNKDSPVYVWIASSPNDSALLLISKNQADYTNPLYLDAEGLNHISTRYAVNPETKKVIVPKIEVRTDVYADGRPPVLKLSLGNAQQAPRIIRLTTVLV